MNSRMFIRRANKEDLKAISIIHKNGFPNSFMSNLGYRFLYEYYYQYLLFNEILLVLINKDNIIIGFISGTNNSKEFYKSLKSNWKNFVLPLSFALFNIKLLFKIIKKLLSIKRFNSINKNPEDYDEFTELTSICVLKKYHNKGFGKILINDFIIKVKSKYKSKGIFLSTDFLKNKNVRKFYESFNFKMDNTFYQSKDRKMCFYSLRF